MAFFFPGISGSLVGEQATLIIIPKESYVSTGVRAYNMELGKGGGVGDSRCIYEVHLTLKAYKHSTNSIKWKGRERRTEISTTKQMNCTYALPTYIRPGALGLALLVVLFT